MAEVVEDFEGDAIVERVSLRGVAGTPENDLLCASALGETTAASQLGRDLAAELLDLGAAALRGSVR